jgi:hypothetical protein
VFTAARCGGTDKQDAGVLNGLVDPARGDFRLRPGSSAIDAGDPLDFPLLDAGGLGRFNAPDAGAHEYNGVAPGPGGGAAPPGSTQAPAPDAPTARSAGPGASGSGGASARGLVGAWGFDEAAGAIAIDASGRGGDGTIVRARRVRGRHGGALAFDGARDMVTVPDAPALRLRTAMTLEAWVKPSRLAGAWRTVILKERRKRLAYALYAADGRARASAGVASRSAGTRRARLPTARWTHLAATWSRSRLRLYRDGVLVSSRRAPARIPASGGPLRIGGNRLRGEWFKGLIDDVRVYDRALSAGEIARDARAAVGG